MSRDTRIKTLLTQTFHPTALTLSNDSHKHHGHAGSDGSGESHYTLWIQAPTFEGKNRVAIHRMINKALHDEFATGLHALSIQL